MTMLLRRDTADRLRKTLGALAPIDGVSIPVFGNSATTVIIFNASATQPQKDSAGAALAAFDWSDAAQTAWEDSTQDPDFAAIRTNAAAAVQTNNAYLALVAPTNADRFTQLDAITRQNTQIIKALGAVILHLTGR
jgi:hypothetical protein